MVGGADHGHHGVGSVEQGDDVGHEILGIAVRADFASAVAADTVPACASAPGFYWLVPAVAWGGATSGPPPR
jgi:hypothetical protein